MPLDCDIKNPLKRDGTSQEKRDLRALKPENVQIDARTSEQLREFARRYATEIQFYDAGNELLGNWATFFEEDIDSNEPHMALFLTFLELFAYAQEHINELTSRHLDFYYKEVLNMARKEAEPDKAHIVFELAKNVSSHLLEEGTKLSAGKDDDKVEMIFSTDKEIVVNTATVGALKSVYVQRDAENDLIGVFAAPTANSADGEGADFEEDSDSWRPFGEGQYELKVDEEPKLLDDDKRTMPAGTLGFAVASPLLRMAEGDRTAILKIKLESAIEAEVAEAVANGLQCYLTGAEGWFEPTVFELYELDADDADYADEEQILAFKIALGAADEAVTDYDEEVYAELYDTNYPMVKLVCATQSDYALHYLETAGLESIAIEQTVSGYRSLILQSGAGLLDSSAPFLPFGPQPAIGSRLLMGSEEVFRKKLDTLSVHIDWHEIPHSNLATHYANYGSPAPANNQFRVQPYIRLEKRWIPTGPDYKLFKSADANEHREITVGLEEEGYAVEGVGTIAYERSLREEDITEFHHSARDGFLALELIGPTTPFKAFGHREYPLVLTQNAIDAAMGESGASTADLPNPPYTPTIKELSLTYTSKTVINLDPGSAAGLDADAYAERVEKFFHVRPFGHHEQHPYITKLKSGSGTPNTVFLMPQFGGEGTLYIGLENLEPSQQISLLFQLAEGTADPDANKETISWSYLTATGWQAFASDEVLEDSTNELLTSGIITFATGSALNDENPWLPTDMHWIRGVTENAEAHAGVLGVHTQAVAVTFEDNGNDLTRLSAPLEASTIKKLATAQAQIKSISQPYASYDGRTKEQDQDYYTRVSERLRHKQRAITIWDYEHLVLQQFPDVYKVKCINHTNKHSEFAPGSVSLVVVSNLRNKNAVNPLQPLTSINTLDEIKAYVDAISTTFVTPIVRNPEFEQVRVRFHVRFHESVDKGYYSAKIKRDINEFLSPWAYSEGKDIVFQGRIHRSMILKFVEDLDYVDFVACFRMDQKINGSYTEDVEEAQASHAAAILVADTETQHLITVMETDECECEELPGDSSLAGIGYWAIEEDFEVS